MDARGDMDELRVATLREARRPQIAFQTAVGAVLCLTVNHQTQTLFEGKRRVLRVLQLFRQSARHSAETECVQLVHRRIGRAAGGELVNNEWFRPVTGGLPERGEVVCYMH